jgi:tyrosinase
MVADEAGTQTDDGYARVKEILDAAAGSVEPSYDGAGRFWAPTPSELAATTIYGVAMVAPAGTPDRGASSGLVAGLRGEWPFDGAQFPPLPWGGTRVEEADVQVISDWIDGLPAIDPLPVLPAGDPAGSVVVRPPAHGERANPNLQRDRIGAPKARQAINHLTETELATLRNAVAKAKSFNRWPRDGRSYNSWAQVHGDECPHGWSIFLPWHRMYLWGFEMQLQDFEPTVTLPYWDWASSDSKKVEAGYIPEAFSCWVTEEMLGKLGTEVSRETRTALSQLVGKGTFTSIDRLLAAAKVEVRLSPEKSAIGQALMDVNPLFSDKRWPGDLGDGTLAKRFRHHYPTSEDITRIIATPTWRIFGGGMDVDQSFGLLDMDPHNTMHIWLGGFPEHTPSGGLMANNLTAAFDPIFWSHHANVDRIWARWQQEHPGVDPPDPGDDLPGVNGTVKDSLSTYKLGYEYVADSKLLPMEPGGAPATFNTKPAGAVPVVLANHRRAEVRLHCISQPARSFIVRVFLNVPDADVDTPVADNVHYAGHFTLFGHGPCVGGPGHCEPQPRTRTFDRRPQHHNEPWDVRFDVTETVAALVAKGETDIHVSLVVLSPGGEDPENLLKLDSISLSFHD